MSDEPAKQEIDSAAMAANLRHVADMIEHNPDLFDDVFRHAFYMVNIFPSDKPTMAKVIRAALAHGAKVDKKVKGEWFTAELRFGLVGIEANARRDEVCERVVVGTETVTKRVPDPDLLAQVPEVEVTETVDKVEWVCRPLLAEDGAK
jgi:hypothetical protein